MKFVWIDNDDVITVSLASNITSTMKRLAKFCKVSSTWDGDRYDKATRTNTGPYWSAEWHLH